MPHLLGDFPTASECSSPIDQHTQVGETSADHMSDLSMPDMGVLLDEFNPEAFPIEPTGPESGRVSFDPPKFPNTSAIANFPELAVAAASTRHNARSATANSRPNHQTPAQPTAASLRIHNAPHFASSIQLESHPEHCRCNTMRQTPPSRHKSVIPLARNSTL